MSPECGTKSRQSRSGSFQQLSVELPIVQLPARASAQALLLLRVESFLLLEIYRSKIQSWRESHHWNGSLASKNMVSAKSNELDCSISATKPLEENHHFSTTVSPPTKQIQDFLLHESPLNSINIIESFALHTRSRVEELLVRYVFVKSFLPVPPAAFLMSSRYFSPATATLFDWMIPDVGNPTLQLQLLRIHQCYVEASTLAQEIIERSQELLHLLFNRCPPSSSVNSEGNVGEFSSVSHESKLGSKTIKEELSFLWWSLSPSSLPHFRGLLWVPSTICSACLSMKLRISSWIKWNDLIRNAGEGLPVTNNLVTDSIDHQEPSISPSTSSDIMMSPFAERPSKDSRSVFSTLQPCPELSSVGDVSDSSAAPATSTHPGVSNVSTTPTVGRQNSCDVNTRALQESHTVESFGRRENELRKNIGYCRREGDSLQNDFQNDSIRIFNFVLYNLKKMVHLLESITIAFMTFHPTQEQPYQFHKEKDPLQLESPNGKLEYHTSMSALDPPTWGQKGLRLGAPLALPPFVKMEKARLRMILYTELATHSSESTSLSIFERQVMSQCWLIPALFMWNNDLHDGCKTQIQSLLELCQKYEVHRDALLARRKSVDHESLSPFDFPRSVLTYPMDSTEESLNSLTSALLRDVTSFVPSALAFEDVRKDCLRAITSLIDSYG